MLRLSFLLLLISCSAYSVLLGWVESPGYPMGYSPHDSVNWTRCAPKGHSLFIRLIHLDLEDSQDCANDAVKVFSNGTLISILCGKKEFEELEEVVNPLHFSSPGGCLTLLFHSDYANAEKHAGFRGFYSIQDFNECEDNLNYRCSQFCHNFIGGYNCACRHGYYLTEDKHTCTVSCNEDLSGLNNGDISSPFWPETYAENANCQHNLSVVENLQLELHFSEVFDVEQGPDGECIDALTIETHSGTLATFCGDKPPPSPLLTHSHQVQIRFTSDGFGANKGFSLHFKTRDKVCLPEVTSKSTVTPLKPEYKWGQTVIVTCDVGYVAISTQASDIIMEYEASCQSTGTWAPSYPCEIVDCGFPVLGDDSILQVVDSAKQSTVYEKQIQFYCSSKYYKLDGNDTYTCNARGEWISMDGKAEMPKCVEVCGMPEKYTLSSGRILGGNVAALGDVPWQLLIKYPKRGGASLINDMWAVTAAHVVNEHRGMPLNFHGGIVNANSSDSIVLQSEKIIIHPGYENNDGTNYDNDIALIRFKSRVNLQPNLTPICLPNVSRGVTENEQGTVSGWGSSLKKRNNKIVKVQKTQYLNYVDIGVYSSSKCENVPTLPSNNKEMSFTNNMFCAGAPGKDSCTGDSGGPFFSPTMGSSEGPYHLIGVVSWGPSCLDPDLKDGKGYYTKVENYVDWIKNTIQTEERNFELKRNQLLNPRNNYMISMCYSSVRLLLRISSVVKMFDPRSRWISFIVWFLYVLVCESLPLPDSGPLIHGEVKSPQYPQPYPPNLLKQWDLNVPEGFQIRLTFTHLDIEPSAGCYYDSVTVLYDKKLLGKFCGTENSANDHHPGYEPILSPGNRLTLVFQTDDYNPERRQNVGFSAQYQATDIDECSAPEPEDGSGPLCSQICLNTLGSYLCACHHGYELHSDQRTCMLSCGGGIFDEPTGHLFSPGYPNPAPHALSCQYVISVEAGFTVYLNFSDKFHIESVNTEEGPNCYYHWLELTVPHEKPVKLCGGTSPGLINTNSNNVTLDYHTDDQGLSNGWSLDYSTNRVKCPVPGVVVKGRVTPSLTEYFYRDYIYVRCDQGYKLMADGREIESFSTMCQSNAQWHLPLPECHIIDCGEPDPLLNGGVRFLSGAENQYLSTVEYHCNEPFYSLLGSTNVTFTCEADRKWRLTRDESFSPVCLPVCGRPTQYIEGYQRIIGGSEAPEHTIPWQVLLNINSNRGGGMVIADRWILTAAHVVVHQGQQSPAQSIRIFMGDTDIHRMETSFVHPASVHVHPEYNDQDGLNFNNDIALIKLQEPITFNAAVMPLCLPAKNATYTTGLVGLVSGFGTTNDGGRQMITNKLKYVMLPVVDQEKCRESITLWKKIRPNTPDLTDNMFCAGTPEGTQDSCQGDSGGPFSVDINGRSWAAGIVSWGIKCGQRGKYGVYTKVINYLDWIKQVMQEN
ncbi:putative LOC107379532-like protein [Nothobranchius furzeri]|uniref:complement subcomponent C1r n=1 Tax=Nothobranchius furzeri TaxID=105023 RepID=A0A9D2YUJ9_NOTFU|nr:putative LOC107379532-like protein [Nothobranchius furzeri]